MTVHVLVSLLFITMIPTDYKITIFSYACLLTFLVTIKILVNSELTAPLQKKQLPQILLSQVHKVMKILHVSKLRIRLCSSHYTALCTEKSMKSISSSSRHYMETWKIQHTPNMNESQ